MSSNHTPSSLFYRSIREIAIISIQQKYYETGNVRQDAPHIASSAQKFLADYAQFVERFE